VRPPSSSGASVRASLASRWTAARAKSSASAGPSQTVSQASGARAGVAVPPSADGATGSGV